MKQAEAIYSRAFTNYISPGRYEELDAHGWYFEEFPHGGGTKPKVIQTIKNLWANGWKVTCGYLATSIRDVHDYYILYKPGKPMKLDISEWLYCGCFIQEQNHPKLLKYWVFKNNKKQTHVGVYSNFQEAKRLCKENVCYDNYLQF